ncbi:unnamed protein product [Parnassius apollo]|uniref:phosphatidylinositol 3-kinase n=1 Tax=Parnassius apollo TaxID=110799 RepID=A0A8S3X8W6_PARAO|nr:unnamed protein product [Parnassius apollo]
MLSGDNTMSDYDLQFQADLEKAQALSLESLALEQFRRQKLLSNTNTDNVRENTANSTRRREEGEGPPPALPPPPRKPPRGRISTSETSSDRSTGTSPTRTESSDLISFSSPTSKSAPKEPHASLKEYIEQISKLGLQTEDININTPETPPTMNNHPYNQRPAHPYGPQYPYNYQQPYTPMPSYPTASPYGMPMPLPTPAPNLPNYSYYAPSIVASQAPTTPYVATNPPMYAPTIPYSQTRMASPAPYIGYPPPPNHPPSYNYNTTNMITRPTRPVSLYPQLSQLHMYPPLPTSSPVVQNVNNNNTSTQTVVNAEPSRDSVESNASKKSSEVSIGSNESNDSIGSLPKSQNLIDFGGRLAKGAEYMAPSECSSSVYEEYDPLDFLYGETEMRDAPVYATVSKRESTMLPSPPPKSIPTMPTVPKRPTTNKLYDCIVRTRNKNYDSEHKAFLKLVQDVRKKFVFSDEKTNPGHVIAARSGGKYPPNTSIKVLVYNAHADEPITFTSDVESTVEHVILTVVCSLDEDIRDDMSGYMLRVWGAKEYLTPGSSLSEYDYIRECVRLEKDVRLYLHEGGDNALARSERDDARDSHLTLDDLISSQGATLTFDNLSILLETLEGELSRVVGVVGAEGSCSPKAVFQAVKAICALAGGVETLHVTYTLNAFAQACTAQNGGNAVTPEIQAESGPYCAVSLRAATAREAVAQQCARLRDAVRALLALYTRARLLDFSLADAPAAVPSQPHKAAPAHTISETVLFCIEAVHCLPLCWNHDEYLFHAQIYYGTRPLKTVHATQSSKIECGGFYPRIIFDTWLNLEDIPVNTLPRESRLVLTLYGRTQRTVDNQHQNNENNQQNSEGNEENGDVQYEQVELGWASIQMFDYDCMLAAGNYVVALWSAPCDRRVGPAPHALHHPPAPHPVINIGTVRATRHTHILTPLRHTYAPTQNTPFRTRCTTRPRRTPSSTSVLCAPPGTHAHTHTAPTYTRSHSHHSVPHALHHPPAPHPVINIGTVRATRHTRSYSHRSDTHTHAPTDTTPRRTRCTTRTHRTPSSTSLLYAPPGTHAHTHTALTRTRSYSHHCAPHALYHPPAPHALHHVINIEVPLYTRTGVKWTNGDEEKQRNISQEELPSFDSLDGHTQSQLLHLIEQGAYQRMPNEGREVMWEKRQYLVQLPGALPLVLLAATNWYGEHRAQLVSLLELWEKPSPLNAMHLLLPCFPDLAVRKLAAKLLNGMSDDDLIRVLPQLTQALRYETYEASPLAELLLSRAMSAPAVAHKLFWLLVHSLPNVPQAPNHEFLGITLEENATECQEVDACLTATWRYRLMLRALLAICGENLTRTLLRQQLLVKTVSEVALSVKCAKEALRQRALHDGGERLAALLRLEPVALPLALHRYVHDVDIKSCSYFSSNTLPLKINFIGVDNAIVPAMFKVGDDLRQDALVLQVIKVMDSLWLKAGLDLRIVTFQALPTSHQRGMIEIVTEAETLRAIQTEWGLTGSFKDKPIAEWLAKHNPSELEYQRARDNFTASCAGYSVATYLLGICDRHNDNIMLKTSGHLFHIDFGKFLGDAQMFGNFKRDRAPFVLTHDMAYVINGGERPTQRFQHFVELCCMAFNIVRAHHTHILDLFALMAMSGAAGVTSAAVAYVRAALMPAATNAEAAAAFARLIHSSLKSKFTPINFFLHNLAQLRASGDQTSSSSELLSFMPRTYTMAQEGRLVRVECLSYEKRYDPEKHYVYALRVYRLGQATPSVLYRSYKHFTELYQKICLHFPLAKVHR